MTTANAMDAVGGGPPSALPGPDPVAGADPTDGAGGWVVPAGLTAFLREWASRRAAMRPEAARVLEAGCGSTSHLPIPDGARVVGIDVSASQLRRNGVLHEAILGDIQRHDFGDARFDFVVCWNVLEHVPEPTLALRNLCSVLAPGGLLVVGVPNLWSVKGVVTRLTPFGLHSLFYRLMGDRSAGTEEFGQFPTYLRRDVAPRRIRRTMLGSGLLVPLFMEYEGPVQRDLRRKLRAADLSFAICGGLSRAVTGGRWDLNCSDAVIVGERPAAEPTA